MKRAASAFVFFVFCGVLSGQQLPLYSQYLYNKFLINPAVAGSDGFTSFNLTAREQWIGYSGAPRTFSFSGQGRILKHAYSIKKSDSKNKVFRPKSDGKVGIGGYVFSDRHGLVQRNGFELSYAYHMWAQKSTQVSLGLAFTGYHFKINEKELNFEDPNDPWLNNELRRGIFVPDADFGIYVLNPRYSVGFSSSQLFGAAARISGEAYSNYSMDRHYYLFGSYVFYPDHKSELVPSGILLMSEQLKPMADIGVNYIYDQRLWAGVSYRTSKAIIVNFGLKYSNLFMGYSFDFTLSEIQKVTYGTHEITVAIKFGDSARKYRWLDRY